MIPRTLHPTASWLAALKAQVRAVGFALRPALAVAGTLGGALALIAVLTALRGREGIPFVPEIATLTALAALILPVAVWRGEYDVRRSYLAALPMDRTRHTLAKLTAGWVWLVVMTAAFMLGLLALTLVTGGVLGEDELRVLARDLPAGTPPGEASAYARRWTTPAWQWATFLTTATVGYLIGSTLVLAGGRARRWLAGAAVLVLFFIFLTEQGFGFGGVGVWVAERLEAFVEGEGTYGLAALFGESGSTFVDETTRVWDDPPTLGRWALTTLLWIGGGAAGVLLVIGRDRRS